MRLLRSAAAFIRSARPPYPAFLRRLLPEGGPDGLDRSIYGYIIHYSLKEQLYLVIVTLLSFPFLYYSLDLPKQIVNHAISGKDFPVNFFGAELDQIPYLLVLCAVFLALVLINGWFKLHLNIKKGQVGERMLRRLRYQLYERILRFPLHHFDRTATGEVIAMMTGELEPVGGFVGEAFALPISQGGTLLTILFFMFVQDPILGTAAIALYPLQGYLIPKMQRVIRRLGRERVRKVPGSRTASPRRSPPGPKSEPTTAPPISSLIFLIAWARFMIFGSRSTTENFSSNFLIILSEI